MLLRVYSIQGILCTIQNTSKYAILLCYYDKKHEEGKHLFTL